MDWKLELVVVPVSDIDRAKNFYTVQAGFGLDVDFRAGDFRVVQLTPPGSACSISLMAGPDLTPGSLKGLHLVVPDIDAARAELLARSAEPGEVFHYEDGKQAPGPDPHRSNYGSFLNFSDPDQNTWVVQEVGRQGKNND